jgi:putative ABC transport system permease protein
MVVPRWKKVLSDLWSNKVRTLLVVLSIAVGVFAVGSVASIYLIMKNDVSADFLSIQPHAASIYTDPFDDNLLFALRKTPGVAEIEGRSSISAKFVGPNGKTYPIQVHRYPALKDTRIDLLRLEQGSPDLRDHQIYLERQVAASLGYHVGDTIQVILSDGRTRDLQVAGIVHAVYSNGFFFSQQAETFSNATTLEWLGGPPAYNEIIFTVSEGGSNEDHVRAVANAVADKVERSGRKVYVTVVIHPGQHPAQQIVDAVLALMGGLGVLVVGLSAFLVVNTISALMGQQLRQIGLMRAVGATVGQVTGLYLALVLAFGVTALIVAVPLSAVVGYATCSWMAGLLNVNLAGFRLPVPALVLEIVVGLGLPVFGALIPVLNGTRMTVREALNSYGVQLSRKISWFDRLLEQVRGLPRPLLISIRNTFRRKGRLVLTLTTLTLGGAIFIGVFGVRDSMDLALVKTFGYILSDVNVDFNQSYRYERLQEAVKGVPGVVSTEGWMYASAQAMKPDLQTGDDVVIFAPPGSSHLIQPVMTSGRWLLPQDENALVVGNHYMKFRPETKVGDVIQVRINRKDHPFTVVGIYEMAGNVTPPIVYTNYEYLTRLTGQVGQASTLKVTTDRSDPVRQNEVQAALEARFKELGMPASFQTSSDTITQQNSLTNIIISLLLFMAILIAVVGGLGLMGTMSMNVLERTREIGVMRSLGAESRAIFQLVVVEGMMIGLISWGLGAVLSIPITRLLDTVVGVALLNVPLMLVFSQQGLWIWLGVVLFLSTLASLLPARNAVRLTLREVLAYE